MFCAGRVVEEDLKRTMKACGGAIQTSVNSMTDDVLGRCELFEEEQIGGERYMVFRYSLVAQEVLVSFRYFLRVSQVYAAYFNHITLSRPTRVFSSKVVK